MSNLEKISAHTKAFIQITKILKISGEEKTTFSSSKNLSSIGALLIVIASIGSAVPYLGLVSLVGLVLLLIGLKGLANFYKEQGIFNNALYSIITSIVGVAIGTATIAITAISTLASVGLNFGIEELVTGTFIDKLGPYFANFVNFNQAWTIIGALFVGAVIFFVFGIISMYFARKSMNQLSSKTGVGLFGTAGMLLFIGAFLVIVVIGVFLIWIGLVVATAAFFMMKEKQT